MVVIVKWQFCPLANLWLNRNEYAKVAKKSATSLTWGGKRIGYG